MFPPTGARVGPRRRDARGGAPVLAGQRSGLLHPREVRLLMPLLASQRAGLAQGGVPGPTLFLIYTKGVVTTNVSPIRVEYG